MAYTRVASDVSRRYIRNPKGVICECEANYFGIDFAGVGLWPFVFAQPTALQLRDQYYISKKEDRRC